jgi:hypothetical protein
MHNKEKKMVRRVVVAQRSSYNSSSTKEIPACARLFCFFVAIGLLLSIVVLLLLCSSLAQQYAGAWNTTSCHKGATKKKIELTAST